MPAFRTSSALAFGLAMLWLAATPSRSVADLTIAVENSTAPSGGVGSFDVVLSDTGGTYQVSGFSVELTLSAMSGVDFTSVDTNTVIPPYIFGSYQSSPSPFSFDTFPTTEFTASDSSFTSPYYTTLTTGSSFGLAHVSYSVASGTAAELVAVTLADIGGGTSLSDVNGDAISFTATNGAITVTPSAIPEPSSFVLLATAIVGVASIARARFGRRALNSRG